MPAMQAAPDALSQTAEEGNAVSRQTLKCLLALYDKLDKMPSDQLASLLRDDARDNPENRFHPLTIALAPKLHDNFNWDDLDTVAGRMRCNAVLAALRIEPCDIAKIIDDKKFVLKPERTDRFSYYVKGERVFLKPDFPTFGDKHYHPKKWYNNPLLLKKYKVARKMAADNMVIFQNNFLASVHLVEPTDQIAQVRRITAGVRSSDKAALLLCRLFQKLIDGRHNRTNEKQLDAKTTAALKKLMAKAPTDGDRKSVEEAMDRIAGTWFPSMNGEFARIIETQHKDHADASSDKTVVHDTNVNDTQREYKNWRVENVMLPQTFLQCMQFGHFGLCLAHRSRNVGFAKIVSTHLLFTHKSRLFIVAPPEESDMLNTSRFNTMTHGPSMHRFFETYFKSRIQPWYQQMSTRVVNMPLWVMSLTGNCEKSDVNDLVHLMKSKGVQFPQNFNIGCPDERDRYVYDDFSAAFALFAAEWLVVNFKNGGKTKLKTPPEVALNSMFRGLNPCEIIDVVRSWTQQATHDVLAQLRPTASMRGGGPSNDSADVFFEMLPETKGIDEGPPLVPMLDKIASKFTQDQT